MTAPSKRPIRLAVILLFVLVLCVFVYSNGGGKYRAMALVQVKPYTNTFFTRQFEADVFHHIPRALMTIHVRRNYINPGKGAFTMPQDYTNYVVIYISAAGRTAEEAQSNANSSAMILSRSVLPYKYGVTNSMIMPATMARPYSVIKDVISPAVSRLLGH